MRLRHLTTTLTLAAAATLATCAWAASPGLWSDYETQLKGAKHVGLTHTITPFIPVWTGCGRSPSSRSWRRWRKIRTTRCR
jgi:hypothetical protein